MAKKEKKKKKYTSIGGQALMEGIMMRGPHKTVMCVRRADGSIVTESMETAAATVWNKIPLLRGIVSLIQSMSLGTKMLMRSAEIAIEDEIKAEEKRLAGEEEKAAQAESTEQLAEAESAEEPVEAESADEPVEAESADEPIEAESADEPAEAESAEEPVEAESTDEHAEAESADRPVEAESTEEPIETESTDEPVEAESTDEPVEAESAEEPVEAKSAEEPVEAESAEAEPAEAPAQADTKADKKSDAAAAAETDKKPEKKGSVGRKIFAAIGCILCLALGVYLFFFAAPEAVTKLVNDIFPGILPKYFADNLAAYHDRWLLGTGIAVKLIILLVLFGLVSLFTGGSKKKKEKKKKKSSGSDLGGESGFLVFVSTVLGFAMAILLFSYVPTWAASAMFRWVFPNVMPADMAAHMQLQSTQNVWRPIIEGIVKIIILVTYMALVSRMKEIHTLFQYHGAEHKTIACYEAGEELIVENVRKYRRFHPRCGTSFLILMVLVGIIIGMAAKYLLPADIANSNLWYPLIKIALIPIMMGIGYELLKFSGKHDNILTRIISAPGMWMQRITTKEPTDEMIECAIAAIIPVIPENGEDMM